MVLKYLPTFTLKITQIQANTIFVLMGKHLHLRDLPLPYFITGWYIWLIKHLANIYAELWWLETQLQPKDEPLT